MKKSTVFLIFILCSSKLFAALLNIDPVNLSFTPGHSIQALEITNEDQSAITLQFDVKNWQQSKNGDDIYSTTKDLLVTPFLVTIPPNHTQLIRLSLLRDVFIEKEQCYRLFIREILPIESTNNGPQRNLKISMQMLLPIFVNKVIQTTPLYHWSFSKKDKNNVSIDITNRGKHHLLITELQLINKQSEIIYKRNGLFTYLLPDSSKSFNLDFPFEKFNKEDLILQIK